MQVQPKKHKIELCTYMLLLMIICCLRYRHDHVNNRPIASTSGRLNHVKYIGGRCVKSCMRAGLSSIPYVTDSVVCMLTPCCPVFLLQTNTNQGGLSKDLTYQPNADRIADHTGVHHLSLHPARRVMLPNGVEHRTNYWKAHLGTLFRPKVKLSTPQCPITTLSRYYCGIWPCVKHINRKVEYFHYADPPSRCDLTAVMRENPTSNDYDCIDLCYDLYTQRSTVYFPLLQANIGTHNVVTLIEVESWRDVWRTHGWKVHRNDTTLRAPVPHIMEPDGYGAPGPTTHAYIYRVKCTSNAISILKYHYSSELFTYTVPGNLAADVSHSKCMIGLTDHSATSASKLKMRPLAVVWRSILSYEMFIWVQSLTIKYHTPCKFMFFQTSGFIGRPMTWMTESRWYTAPMATGGDNNSYCYRPTVIHQTRPEPEADVTTREKSPVKLAQVKFENQYIGRNTLAPFYCNHIHYGVMIYQRAVQNLFLRVITYHTMQLTDRCLSTTNQGIRTTHNINTINDTQLHDNTVCIKTSDSDSSPEVRGVSAPRCTHNGDHLRNCMSIDDIVWLTMGYGLEHQHCIIIILVQIIYEVHHPFVILMALQMSRKSTWPTDRLADTSCYIELMATGNNDSYRCYGLDVLSRNNPEPEADVNNGVNPLTNPLRVKCDFDARGQELPSMTRSTRMILVVTTRILRCYYNAIIYQRTIDSRPNNASNKIVELVLIPLWQDLITVNESYICTEIPWPHIQLSRVRPNVPCIQYRQWHHMHISSTKSEHRSMLSEQQKAICGTYETGIYHVDATVTYHILSYVNFIYLQSSGIRASHETLMATANIHDYRRFPINSPLMNNITRIRGTGSWGLCNCPYMDPVDVMNNVLSEKHAGNVNRRTCNEHPIKVYSGCVFLVSSGNAYQLIRYYNMVLYSTYLVYAKIISVEAKHYSMHPSNPRHFDTCRAQTRLFPETNQSDKSTAEPIVVICAISRPTLLSKIQKLPLIYERFSTTCLVHQWFYVYQYVTYQTEYHVLYATAVNLLKMYAPTPTKALHE